MISIFGIEVDIISLVPALFAVILSLFNFYKMSRPADIVPNEIIEYGLISSSYHEGYKLCIPLIFYNNGPNKGLITNVAVGFILNGKTKFLDIVGKARLSELEDGIAGRDDWDNFTKYGYKIVQPSYPITVLGNEATDTVLIATSDYEDGSFPVNQKSECIIEVSFGKKKSNKIKFPFYISDDSIPDNRITWFSPVVGSKGD